MPRSGQKPVVLGVAGMGGFAGSITNLVLKHGPSASPPVELAAVCDPNPAGHDGRDAELREKGIAVHPTYEALLAEPAVEAVWLPVPIDLHRPFTEQALSAGKAVMVEKPVAGSIDDLDAMIVARDAAGLPVAVGFHDIYDQTTMPLKRRILAGEFGELRHATLMACWPRSSTYFARSNWAGRFKRHGVWVMDSPANNALAHYINIALFLLGPSESESANPEHVEAELYRAADIENYDTISMRLRVAGGASLLVLLTHACSRTHQPRILFEGTAKSFRWTTDEQAVRERHGDQTQIITAHYTSREHMIGRLARLVRGIDDPDTAVATLETARCHTVAVNGASAATPVRNVPRAAIETTATAGGTVRAIRGIEEAFFDCAENRELLHESGRLQFTREPGTLDLRGYQHFAGPRTLEADGQPAHVFA